MEDPAQTFANAMVGTTYEIEEHTDDMVEVSNVRTLDGVLSLAHRCDMALVRENGDGYIFREKHHNNRKAECNECGTTYVMSPHAGNSCPNCKNHDYDLK